VVVLFAAGADDDPPGQSGMTALVERLLGHWAAEVPGRRTIISGSDYILAYAVAPKDGILDELAALGTQLSHSRPDDAAMRQARDEVLGDIARRAGGDATHTAITDATESVLPSRGQGRRGGIAGEVKTLDAAAVEAFWRGTFAGANARVLVLGNLEPGIVRARVEKAFGSLPAGAPPTQRPEGTMTVHGTLVMGEAPSAMAFAVRAPPVQDHAFPAFLVLAARLLEPRSGAGWHAQYDPILDPGVLTIVGPLRNDENPEPAAARMRKEWLAIIARPLTPEDVTNTRSRFGDFLGYREINASACQARPPETAIVARVRRAQLSVDAQHLNQSMGTLTPQDLAVARELFAPDRTAAVLAGGAIH
jgi:predicted Zn-dependent peptidase